MVVKDELHSCASWKRFIRYVEWRGDHGSSLLVIILRPFLFPLARNFPRSPTFLDHFPSFFHLFVVWCSFHFWYLIFISRKKNILEDIKKNGNFPSVSFISLCSQMSNSFPMLFTLMIVTPFLRNVHYVDDNSSFVRWDRVFFRIMKPICAARTANVKVNEGFWTRAVGNIYSANFTVKFPLCRKREMGLVVLRETCPLSPFYALWSDFWSDLSSHSRPYFGII